MRALTPATAAALAAINVGASERISLGIDKDGTRFVATFFHANGTIKVARPFSVREMRELVSRIPERKELSGGCKWLFSATDYTVGIIDALWPRSQLDFSDEQARDMYAFRLLSLAEQDKRADIYARFKVSREVPTNDIEMHGVLPLSPYQVVACYNAMRSDGYAYFMDPGTGKTAATIARICNDVKSLAGSRVYRALIVAPKNVRYNWGCEFQKFTTRIGAINTLRGDDIDRRRCLIEAVTESRDAEYMAVICGYEQLVSSWRYLEHIPWDLAVLDEMHFIKNAETKRFKFAKELRENSAKRMGLTGTPITNSPLDLWTQLEFLGAGYSGFVNHKNFKDFYGVYDKDESGRNVLVSVQNMPFLQERILRHSFAITKEEALPDMPKKNYDLIECQLSAAQREAYDEIRDNLILEAERQIAHSTLPRSMVIKNILTMFLRLAQITSGILKWDAITDDDGNILQPGEIEYFGENPKLDALVETAKAWPANEKGIIWACFVPNIVQIATRFRAEGLPCVEYYGKISEKNKVLAENAFNNDDNIRWFVGNPTSGGVGLNLVGHPQTPGPHKTHCTLVNEFSQNWQPGVRWQGEDRAHRRGTEMPVLVRDFVVPGTVDEEIRARVMEKKITAMTIADLRQIMRNIISGKIE